MTTDNRTLLNDASAITGWTGDDAVTVTSNAGDFYEGTEALSTQLSNALEQMHTTSIGGTRSMTDASVWILVKDNLQSAKASGGGQVVLTDGTDLIGFYTNGNDDPGLSLPSYYNCLKLDVSNRSALSANAYTGVIANLTVASITGVGYGTIHQSKANGAIDNVWIDASYFIANTSYALTINGGTVGTPEAWSDVAGDDVTNGWGMVANLQGSKYDINASWQWGDTANADSYFEAANFQVYIDARDMGTGNFLVRTIAGTGTNSLVLTDGIFQNLGTPTVWDLSDTDMNTLAFTRVTFNGIGAMTCPVNATGKDFVGVVYNNCGLMAPNGMDCVGLSFNGALDALGAMLLDTAGDSDNVLGATFVSDGTGHAIYITAAGTYDFIDFFFTGYSGTGTDAAVYNNSGGAVTINVLGGDTPTVRNGTSATTTINNSVALVSDGLFEGTAVRWLANETVGTVTKGDTILQGIANSAGEVTTSINYEGAFGAGLDVLVRARNQGLSHAAIADDGTVLTDETAEANDPSTNDMTLTPAVPAVNDAYYFGHNEEFDQLKVWVTTAGVNQTITWEYWNGAWTALSGVVDGTSSFTTTGDNIISWTAPSDWADTTVNSQGPYRYVRARVSAVGGSPTGASGRQCQLDVTRYLPIPPSGDLVRTITSAGLTVTLSQTVDSISRPFG